MKVFLSYSNYDKALAAQVKAELVDRYGLEVFLAHEDIQPSSEWQQTILEELEASEVFLPVLTASFGESEWTDQETGVALGLHKLIVPLKVSADPRGFVGRLQALRLDPNAVPTGCRTLAELIASRPDLAAAFRDGLIVTFGKSWSFDDAGDNARLLLDFGGYTRQQVEEIMRHTLNNPQIKYSRSARTPCWVG